MLMSKMFWPLDYLCAELEMDKIYRTYSTIVLVLLLFQLVWGIPIAYDCDMEQTVKAALFVQEGKHI